MQYLIKYLTSAPIAATITLVVVAVIFIELNYFFPGLQYGTYFHSLP
ncbi:MAG: photosystem I reaction center subunit IX [Cyanobacteria bacterium P01_A01_bin.83]